MILVKMRPEELKDAVKRNIPVIMAAGVVEYHGPHLPNFRRRKRHVPQNLLR
jgi:creatinine amidohydrolase/Fe(II)-dependent formamide hydrolase-like protein